MSLFPATELPQPIQRHGRAKWALSSRIFHWVSVVLLIITWVMIQLNDEAMTDRWLDLHKAFGLSVLFWTLARLINRLFTRDPYAIPMPKWQTGLSHLTHMLLYVLLMAMPLTGWLTAMYSGDKTSFFGWFDMPMWVAQNFEKEHFFENIHTNILWTTLWVFTLLHIVAAFYHQFFKKDHLIKRMV